MTRFNRWHRWHRWSEPVRELAAWVILVVIISVYATTPLGFWYLVILGNWDEASEWRD